MDFFFVEFEIKMKFVESLYIETYFAHTQIFVLEIAQARIIHTEAIETIIYLKLFRRRTAERSLCRVCTKRQSQMY